MNRIQYISQTLQDYGFSFTKTQENYNFKKEINHFILEVYSQDGFICVKITDRYSKNIISSKRFHYLKVKDEDIISWVLDLLDFFDSFNKIFCQAN